jgi:GTP cyclohydrolase FolE2
VNEDILVRLRDWRGIHLARLHEVIDEAADEIDRLRSAIRRLADQDATLSACDGAVTVTMDGTLTDAEREAVASAAEWAGQDGMDRESATLRALLQRTK